MAALVRPQGRESEEQWFDYVGLVVLSPCDECQVDRAISKAYTLLEAGGNKMPMEERMLLTIWLGYLTPNWQEAETLKFIACQEYLIYRCRGQPAIMTVECWLRCLQIKTADETPIDGLSCLLDRLRQMNEPFGEYFRENRFEQIIEDPMVLLDHKAFMSFLITGKRRSDLLRIRSQSTNQHDSSQKSAIELETVRYWKRLNQDCATLETMLEVLGERIKRRRDDMERFHAQIHVVVAVATYKRDDLSVALKLLKLAEDGQEEDMVAWRNLYHSRQMMLITAGRLQRLLDIKKKSNNNNNNKNKNKNRSMKKKLQQDYQAESMDGEGELIVDAEAVVKVEERGEAFGQPNCLDNVLRKTVDVLSDCGDLLGGAWEFEKARANGRKGW